MLISVNKCAKNRRRCANGAVTRETLERIADRAAETAFGPPAAE
jgi:hypothetical protein